MIFSAVTAVTLLLNTLHVSTATSAIIPVLPVELVAELNGDLENTLDLRALKKPIRKFVEANPNIDQFTETCQNMGDCDDMYYMADTYYLDHAPEEIMSVMATSSPQELWTKNSKFQLGYYPAYNNIYTHKDDAPAVEENMIVILQIKLFGIKSIPATFKVVRLDKEDRIVEFSYVEENGNRGIQSLRIYAHENGSKIIHKTQYKSGKNLRDKVLYPWIHGKLTDGFYKNLDKLIVSKQASR